jgi:hypothetical protein
MSVTAERGSYEPGVRTRPLAQQRLRSLEQAVEFINDDELVEVTPTNLCVLAPHGLRAGAARTESGLTGRPYFFILMPNGLAPPVRNRSIETRISRRTAAPELMLSAGANVIIVSGPSGA